VFFPSSVALCVLEGVCSVLKFTQFLHLEGCVCCIRVICPNPPMPFTSLKRKPHYTRPRGARQPPSHRHRRSRSNDHNHPLVTAPGRRLFNTPWKPHGYVPPSYRRHGKRALSAERQTGGATDTFQWIMEETKELYPKRSHWNDGNRVLIAYDCSGSTNQVQFYHRMSADIVKSIIGMDDEFSSQIAVSQVDVLLWDSEAKIADLNELNKINDSLNGYGGTRPSFVARHCIEKGFHGNLVLITDGEIGTDEIDTADEILHEWKFAQVECHVIQQYGDANMSVFCPFFRNSPHVIYSHNQAKRDKWKSLMQVTTDDFLIVADIVNVSKVEEFESLFPRLEKVLISKTMGKAEDVELRDELLKMRQRLIQSTTFGQAKKRNYGVELDKLLSSGDCESAVAVCQKMVDQFYESRAVDADGDHWSKKLARLISMSEGAIRNSFGQGAISDKLQRAVDMEVFEADKADVHDADESVEDSKHFVCPVTYEPEKDIVLLVIDGNPILRTAKKKVMDDLLNCPLNVFKYPRLVQAISDRIDHPLSLRSLKESKDSGILQNSPFTRKPVLGALVLGAYPDHVKATNWTLAKILADGKVCGNLDLWFAVVWMIAKSKNYLHDVLPNIEEHLSWRLVNNKTFASLSGLPEFVTTRMTLRSALWYILASPRLSMPQAFSPLRAHIKHLQQLKELFALTGIPLPAGVEEYHARIDGLLSLLGICKRHTPEAFKSQIAALHQVAIRTKEENIDKDVLKKEKWVPWIILTGPAPISQTTQVQGEFFGLFSRLQAAEIVGLSTFVSPKLSAKNIDFPLSWSPPQEIPNFKDSWCYKVDDFKCISVEVCPDTCRPLSVIDGKPWKEFAEEAYGAKKLLSTHHMFGRFVAKYDRYPNEDEFLLFLYNRYVLYGLCKALPAQTLALVQQTFADFNKITMTMDPDDFATRFRKSAKMTVRTEAEAID
jgi:hypothetical protein